MAHRISRLYNIICILMATGDHTIVKIGVFKGTAAIDRSEGQSHFRQRSDRINNIMCQMMNVENHHVLREFVRPRPDSGVKKSTTHGQGSRGNAPGRGRGGAKPTVKLLGFCTKGSLEVSAPIHPFFSFFSSSFYWKIRIPIKIGKISGLVRP